MFTARLAPQCLGRAFASTTSPAVLFRSATYLHDAAQHYFSTMIPIRYMKFGRKSSPSSSPVTRV